VDETAVAEIYRRYGGAVWRRCMTILGNDAFARDVTQDVFVRCIQHRRELRDGRELLAWLYRVATNLCLNQLRHQKLRSAGDRERGGADVPAIEPSAENDPTTRILIDELLDGVDLRTRQLAIYVFVDGMSHAEAAQVARVSERTVRNCLQRLRTRGSHALKTRLQEES
jgi:RNA polymerase sigma-70 factor (ECF subfamily)